MKDVLTSTCSISRHRIHLLRHGSGIELVVQFPDTDAMATANHDKKQSTIYIEARRVINLTGYHRKAKNKGNNKSCGKYPYPVGYKEVVVM